MAKKSNKKASASSSAVTTTTTASSAVTTNTASMNAPLPHAPSTSSMLLATAGPPPPPHCSLPPRAPVTAGSSRSLAVETGGAVTGNLADEMNGVMRLFLDLRDHDRRAHALSELAKKKEMYHQMAPIIWHSFGTVAILMQELVAVYPFVSPPHVLTPEQSNRACNALALFQCVASHPELRSSFAKAWIPFFLYVFIEASSSSRSYEHLRLAALGVMGALVKTPDSAIAGFLLSSDIMSMCMNAMESGSELSRTVSVFIFQRLLMDDLGLNYMCQTHKRLLAANHALGNVVASLNQNPSVRLLRLVIKCYLRLSVNERGRRSLKFSLPRKLIDGTFDHCLAGEPMVRIWLEQLIKNVSRPVFV